MKLRGIPPEGALSFVGSPSGSIIGGLPGRQGEPGNPGSPGSPGIQGPPGDVSAAQLAASEAASKARANHTGTQTSSTISDFTEAAQDAIAALLAGASGVTLSYNDAANTLTITGGGSGGLDAEAVRDAIGVAMIGTGLITITVNDAADTITISTTADATNATNVDAAGAVMNSDTTTAGMAFVIDEDNMASNLDTKVPTQQSVKAYVGTYVTTVAGTLQPLDADLTALAAQTAPATKLAGIATGATANDTDANLKARANHTGTQSADTLTDGATNKAFLATERTKLTGIAASATANSLDATLLARANHTGTQLAATISDFGTAADARVAAAAATGTSSLVRASAPTITNPTITNYVETVVPLGTVTTTNTISLTAGTVQTATLTASTACTFTMPTATAGKSFVLLLKQAAATGLGTAAFTGVKWPTAGAPTVTPTAGKMDIFTFIADGASWYGSVAQGFTP